VLDARAHGAELCLRAANSALMHQGARGYLMSSDVQRRVREAQFVAIVTPAIKHLRKEIARLSAEEMPACMTNARFRSRAGPGALAKYICNACG
jgi:alkylation response protein AidB-like acyl-CoA dehydrogenase